MALQSLSNLTQFSFYYGFFHHWQPLKRSKWFGNEGIDTQSQRSLVPLIFQIGFKPNRHIHNGINILWALTRQPDHEVQPIVTKPRRYPEVQRPPKMFLGDPLIDRRPHPLATRFGRHGQRLHPTGNECFHQPRRHGIHPKGGHGHSKLRGPNIITESIDLRVIGNGRSHETDTFFIRLRRRDLFLQHTPGPMTRAAKAIPCHAKAAMTTTAPCRFNKVEIKFRIRRNHYCMGRIGIQIPYPLAAYPGRDAGCMQYGNFTGILILRHIKRWHIDAGNIRQSPQNLLTGTSSGFRRVKGIHKPSDSFFTFTDEKSIKKRS